MPASCVAYGPDRVDQFRGAAGYIDRKGEKPPDVPVQAPRK
jgi:putative tryptophan/tyrosine transport system substrate-binding protein